MHFWKDCSLFPRGVFWHVGRTSSSSMIYVSHWTNRTIAHCKMKKWQFAYGEMEKRCGERGSGGF
jgi:hypothetical protein